MNQTSKRAGRIPVWWRDRVLPRAIFLKQRLQHADRCFVTCPGNQDGLGAQLQSRLSGMLYAECQGLTYVHTPLTRLDFAPAGEPDWHERWERFLGIGEGERTAAEVARTLGPPRLVSNATQIRIRPDTFWSLPNCHAYADLYPHHYLRVTDRVAARYAAAPKDSCRPHYTPGVLNVALHMRRGQDLSRKLHLRSGDSFIATVVQEILASAPVPREQVVLRVFSQGEEKDFPALMPFGVEFHLNEDLFATFDSLVKADVLVMAKSCLSYSAALLSRGVKIYEPTGHRPLPGWLVTRGDGRVDQYDLGRRLETCGGRRAT